MPGSIIYTVLGHVDPAAFMRPLLFNFCAAYSLKYSDFCPWPTYRILQGKCARTVFRVNC